MSQLEFFQSTPRYLETLRKARERQRMEAEFMVAQLTAMVVNCSMAAPKKPVTARDFMLTGRQSTTHSTVQKCVPSKEHIRSVLRSTSR